MKFTTTRIHETRIRERLEPDMRIKTLYSMPLTLYEIDLLHYTSIGTDKEYFADALILKALDFEGEKKFTKMDRPKLLGLRRETLEAMYLEMFANDMTLSHTFH